MKPRKQTLSVVILTHNEASILGRCLKSVAFCDEIIVIDDKSTDKSQNVARSFGAKVFTRPLSNDFAAQRNFGQKKAKSDWILVISPDEQVSSQLRRHILRAIQSDKYVAYSVTRVDTFFGKELLFGESGKYRSIRLVKKGVGEWKRRVHETWEVAGPVGNLTGILNHNPHESLADFFNSINWYSTLHAQANMEAGKESSLAKVIVMPVLKFANNYVRRQGYKDGVPGFVHAIMMSLHSFLAWGKMYFVQLTQ